MLEGEAVELVVVDYEDWLAAAEVRLNTFNVNDNFLPGLLLAFLIILIILLFKDSIVSTK